MISMAKNVSNEKIYLFVKMVYCNKETQKQYNYDSQTGNKILYDALVIKASQSGYDQ